MSSSTQKVNPWFTSKKHVKVTLSFCCRQSSVSLKPQCIVCALSSCFFFCEILWLCLLDKKQHLQRLFLFHISWSFMILPCVCVFLTSRWNYTCVQRRPPPPKQKRDSQYKSGLVWEQSKDETLHRSEGTSGTLIADLLPSCLDIPQVFVCKHLFMLPFRVMMAVCLANMSPIFTYQPSMTSIPVSDSFWHSKKDLWRNQLRGKHKETKGSPARQEASV